MATPAKIQNFVNTIALPGLTFQPVTTDVNNLYSFNSDIQKLTSSLKEDKFMLGIPDVNTLFLNKLEKVKYDHLEKVVVEDNYYDLAFLNEIKNNKEHLQDSIIYRSNQKFNFYSVNIEPDYMIGLLYDLLNEDDVTSFYYSLLAGFSEEEVQKAYSILREYGTYNNPTVLKERGHEIHDEDSSEFKALSKALVDQDELRRESFKMILSQDDDIKDINFSATKHHNIFKNIMFFYDSSTNTLWESILINPFSTK